MSRHAKWLALVVLMLVLGVPVRAAEDGVVTTLVRSRTGCAFTVRTYADIRRPQELWHGPCLRCEAQRDPVLNPWKATPKK